MCSYFIFKQVFLSLPKPEIEARLSGHRQSFRQSDMGILLDSIRPVTLDENLGGGQYSGRDVRHSHTRSNQSRWRVTYFLNGAQEHHVPKNDS